MCVFIEQAISSYMCGIIGVFVNVKLQFLKIHHNAFGFFNAWYAHEQVTHLYACQLVGATSPLYGGYLVNLLNGTGGT